MAQRILILEDDVDLRETLADALEEAGYPVVQAGDSSQAISWSRRTSLDLLITDVRMAGIDGIDTLEILRGIQPALKSIIITGYASDSAPARAVTAGAGDYLHKPFGLQDLLSAVRRMLEAEAESSGYQQVLGKWFGSLLESAGAVAARAQLQRLEADRQRAFQALYVSIKSRRLSPNEALEVWERLSQIEIKREQMKASGLHLELRQQLAEQYGSITMLLGVLERAPDASVPLERATSPEQRVRFTQFYQRIRDGQVSLEQMKLAPLLRSLANDALQGSQELNNLYRSIWGSS